jgi:hypothetical protein
MVDMAAINQLKNPLGNLEGGVSMQTIMQMQAGKLNTLHRGKLLMRFVCIYSFTWIGKKGQTNPIL